MSAEFLFNSLKCVSRYGHVRSPTRLRVPEKRGERYTDRQRESEKSKQKQKQCCNRTQGSHLGNVGRGLKWGKGVIKNTSLSSGIFNNTARRWCGFIAQQFMDLVALYGEHNEC